MGQRFQVYIRYNGGENIVAVHLQWCWGHFAIQKTAQLLDFIQKNIQYENSSYFLKNSYDIISARDRRDYKALTALIQLNIRDGSFVNGIDLVQEACECYDEFKETDYFIINPFQQDNNDGFLVIDVQEKEEEAPKVKYCFDLCKKEKFVPISANRYYEQYEEDDYKTFAEWNNDEVAYFENLEKTLIFVESFEILNKTELKEIFEKKYSKKSNIITTIRPV